MDAKEIPIDSPSEQTKEQWFEAGRAHFTSQRYEAALAAFEHALAVDPTYVDAWYCPRDAQRVPTTLARCASGAGSASCGHTSILDARCQDLWLY
jgi:tetratricopeptide (TPR) repeat protein